MLTKEQYAEKAKNENVYPLYANINGTNIELTKDEYDASIEAWALMRWHQDNPDQQPIPPLPN